MNTLRAMTVGLLLTIPFSQSPASTLSIGASRDTTLYSENSNNSNGSGDHFFAGKANTISGGALRRALIGFDIAGSIPVGATIDSVTLTLNVSAQRFGAAGQTVGLHRLLANWGEGASDAFGTEGTGTAALDNDATWAYRFYNTANPTGSPAWTAPGGDFSLAASATQFVDDLGTFQWTSAQMAADVQQWLDTPSANFGWLILGDESLLGDARRFDSRTNPTSANRPVLQIFYTNEIPGDANGDGTVDVSDLGILGLNWGASNTGFDGGDFNRDGTVDVSDLGILGLNWGNSTPPPTSSLSFQEALASLNIPEPAALSALLPLSLLLLRRGRPIVKS